MYFFLFKKIYLSRITKISLTAKDIWLPVKLKSSIIRDLEVNLRPSLWKSYRQQHENCFTLWKLTLIRGSVCFNILKIWRLLEVKRFVQETVGHLRVCWLLSLQVGLTPSKNISAICFSESPLKWWKMCFISW